MAKRPTYNRKVRTQIQLCVCLFATMGTVYSTMYLGRKYRKINVPSTIFSRLKLWVTLALKHINANSKRLENLNMIIQGPNGTFIQVYLMTSNIRRVVLWTLLHV